MVFGSLLYYHSWINKILNRAQALAELTPTNGKPLAEDEWFQTELASLRVDAEAIQASEQRVMAQLSAGEPPGSVSSLLNAKSAETQQRADEFALEVAAHYGIPLQPEALTVGSMPPVGPDAAVTLMPTFLNNRMRTIAGGSSEVQRNIVAKAILGL